MMRSKSEPVGTARLEAERSLIAQHFELDRRTGAVVGPKRHEKNTARTVHDWYNIIALIPICVTNAMCWQWGLFPGMLRGEQSFATVWSGAYFHTFFYVTLAYFVTDVLWVVVVPSCVASPSVIVGHHVATLLYLLVPYLYPEYGWLMGACLSVELNTWFLIARRVFNRDGRQPLTLSASTPGGPIHIKLISVCFYITWVVIRLLVYPALYFVICAEYGHLTLKVGSYFNALSVAPVLQAVFVLLNLKWSYDLVMSKLKTKKKTGKDKGGL